RLDMGMSFEVPFFRFGNKYTYTQDKHYHTYSIPEFGYVQKWRDYTVGLGLYGVGGAGAELYFDTPFFREKKEGRSKLGLAKITPTISRKVTPELFLGLSLNIHFGTFDIHYPLGPVYLELDNLTGYGGGFSMGALYKVNEQFSFGFSYTSQSFYGDFEADDAFMELSHFLGGQKINYEGKMLDFQVPQKLTAGFAYKPFKRLIIGFEAEWVNYSHTFKKMKLKFYEGNGPDRKLVLDLDYRDIYVLAVGIDYNVWKGLVIRTGYDYCSDFSPSGSNIPVLGIYDDIHNFTIGAGYRWEKWEFNFAYLRSLIYREDTGKTNFPAPELNDSFNHHRDFYYSIMISYLF
ncbi:MAG: outer membrane protein transport protein, partial [Thermodesulfobacteriota bacterium]|nr:outer membrane protein transport protein [Thermodesulfobacteriota bacterium]